MKRMISLLLVFAMVVGMLPMTAWTAELEETELQTQEVSADNSCGDDLTWAFDEATGTLTISGSGEMDDYNWDNIPWYSFKRNLLSVVMEEGVTRIGESAFNGCEDLLEVEIPNSVTSIGEEAFLSCESLRSVKIPNGVSNIERATFYECISLEQIELPDSVASIDEISFYGCSSLNSITIPKGVNSIGWNAFCFCDNLLSFDVDPENGTFASDTEGVLFSKDYTTLVCYPGGLKGACSIPDGVTNIGDLAFSGHRNVTSVIISDSVTDIGQYAFSECGNLTSVTLLDSVTYIDYYAFSGCSSLQNIRIPKQVSCIKSFTFENCSSLESIVIPSSVGSIEVGAFFNCNSLTDVFYEGSEEDWAEIGIDTRNNECLLNTTVHYNSEGDDTGDITQPIDPHEHSYTANVTSPTCTEKGYTTYTCGICGDSYLGDYVDATDHSFVNGACSACGAKDPDIIAQGTCGENLTWLLDKKGTLTISGSGKMYNYYLEGDGDTLPPWLEENVEVNKIIFDGNITSIGNEAFCFTSITEITIPASVSEIYYSALDYIDTLEKIYVESGNTLFSNDDFGVLFDKDKTAVIKAPTKLSGNYTAPTSVTHIYDNAFHGCTEITGISWPDSINTIGQGAFSGCTSLEYIRIPRSVTLIDFYTFNGCTGLTEIQIPSGITVIEYAAFYNSNLKDVFYEGSEEEWAKITIESENESLTNASIHYNSPGPDNESAKAQAAYEAILNEYRNACAMNSDEYLKTSETDFDYLNWWLISYYHRYGGTNIAYAYYDIDSNGVDELLIGSGSNSSSSYAIIGLYAFDGSNAVILNNTAGDRQHITIYTDGTIKIYGSSGASESHENYYRLADGHKLDEIVSPSVLTEVQDFGWKLLDEENTDSIVRAVRYYSQWDVNTQVAHFGPGDYLGSQVTEETDPSFVANPTQYLGEYVLVETKPRTDGEEGPDTLISVKAVETKTGTVTSANATTIVIGAENYATPADLAQPERHCGQFVVYHIYNGALTGIEILETKTGILTYWDAEANAINIKLNVNDEDVILYHLSSVADEDSIDFLGKSGARNNVLEYVTDCNKIIYRIVESGFNPEKDAWSFRNNYDGFDYDNPYRISNQRYESVFGASYVASAKASSEKIFKSMMPEWKGNCFGMSVTSVLFYLDMLDWNYYWGETFENVNSYYTEMIRKIASDEIYAVSNQGRAITELIESYQILQFGTWYNEYERGNNSTRSGVFSQEFVVYTSETTVEHNPEGNYIKTLLDKIINSSEPLLINMVYDGGAHTVVTRTDKAPELTDTGWWKVYIYDPNHPYLSEEIQTEYSRKPVSYYSNGKDCYIELLPSKNGEGNQWRWNGGDNGNEPSKYRGSDANGRVLRYFEETSVGSIEFPEYLFAFPLGNSGIPVEFDGTESWLSRYQDEVGFLYAPNGYIDIYSNDGILLCSIQDGAVISHMEGIVIDSFVSDMEDNSSLKNGRLSIPYCEFNIECGEHTDFSIVGCDNVINIASSDSATLHVSLNDGNIQVASNCDNEIITQITNVFSSTRYTSVVAKGILTKGDSINLSLHENRLTAQFTGEGSMEITTDNDDAPDEKYVMVLDESDGEVRNNNLRESVSVDHTSHTAGTRWSLDSDNHWHTCTLCNEIMDLAAHSGGIVTCTDAAICSTCGASYGTTDSTNHTGETEIRNAKDPTESEEGYTGDTYCLGCGEMISSGTIIPALTAVMRVAGTSRVDTALEVADALKEALGVEKFDTIILANGEDKNFADALTGSYLATVKNAPILMYRTSGLSDSTKTFIQNNLKSGGTVYLLGGELAIPASVAEELSASYTVKRLAGGSRFDTNLAILEEAGVGDKEILIARGFEFADSLSASATGLPILMVNEVTGKLTDAQIEFLQKHKDNAMTILGGTIAVSEALEATIEEVVGKNVDRVYGTSREETSVEIAKRYFDAPEFAVIAYSRKCPDGLCGGPLAYAMGAPLLLVNAGQERHTNAYITANEITSGYVLGGTLVITDMTARAVFGLPEDAVIDMK